MLLLQYVQYILIGVLCTGANFVMVNSTDEIRGNVFYRTEKGLTAIPTDIPSGIGKVFLDHNSLTTVWTDSFSGLTYCTHLSLNGNSIRSIELDAFNGLVNLQVLDLRGNQLSALVKGMFNGMPNLQYLYLSQNFIESIASGSFEKLTGLKKLYLNVNSLVDIKAEMWIGLSSLNQLDAQNNKNLKTISTGGLVNLTKLTVLHLHDCALTSISVNVFFSAGNPGWHLGRLRMSLSGNPLQCDSRLCWLQEAEAEGRITWFIDRSTPMSPTCSNMRNVPWHQVSLQCDLIVTDKPEVQEIPEGAQVPPIPRCSNFNTTQCSIFCAKQNKILLVGAASENGCLTCQCKEITQNNRNDSHATLKFAFIVVGCVSGLIIILLVLVLILHRKGYSCVKTSPNFIQSPSYGIHTQNNSQTGEVQRRSFLHMIFHSARTSSIASGNDGRSRQSQNSEATYGEVVIENYANQMFQNSYEDINNNSVS